MLEESNLLADSLPQWRPFPDTVEALRHLSSHYGLVIFSNIDDDLFAETQKHLPVHFDAIITAEQVKSYKPGLAHFHEAFRRLAITHEQLLHVASSLYHDHVPAKQLGIRTVWVSRPTLLPGIGLAPEVSTQPDLVVPDLATLAVELFRANSPV